MDSALIEWLLLLLCVALLLPRIFALCVNTVIYRVLRSQSLITVSIGGISMRRITEISLTLRALPLPPPLPLSLSLSVSVDEVSWQPSWQKLLTVGIKGAKVKVTVNDTHTDTNTHIHAPANNDNGSDIHGHCDTPSLNRMKSTIPELLNGLSSVSGSGFSTLYSPPVNRFYGYLTQRILLSMVHSLALSVSTVTVMVVKADSAVIVRLASFLAFIEPSTLSHTNHSLNLRCGGIEVRVENDYDRNKQFYQEESFRENFLWRNSVASAGGQPAFNALFVASSVTSAHLKIQHVPANSVPPLLTVEPFIVVSEITVNHSDLIPTGIARVECRSQGVRLHLDPMRLIPAVAAMLAAYRTIIGKIIHQSQTQHGNAGARAHTHTTSDTGSSCSSRSHPLLLAARYRDQLLRFLPRTAALALHRVTVTVYQRQDDTSIESLLSVLPSDIYTDLVNLCKPSLSQPRSVSDTVTVSPIVQRLDLTLALILIQVQLKTRYPLTDTPQSSLLNDSNDYENFLSALDCSITIARGPQVNMSGMCELPLLSVHSLKIDTSVVAAPNSDLNSHSHQWRRRHSDADTDSDAHTHTNDDIDLTTINSFPSLFHPIHTVDPVNSQTLTVVMVTPIVNFHSAIGQWIEFGCNVGHRASMVMALIPVTPVHTDKDNISVNDGKQLAAPPSVSRPLSSPTFISPTNANTLMAPLPSPKTRHHRFRSSVEDLVVDGDGERVDVIVIRRASMTTFKHPGSLSHTHTIIDNGNDSGNRARTSSVNHSHSDSDGDWDGGSASGAGKRIRVVRRHLVATIKVISNAQIHLYQAVTHSDSDSGSGNGSSSRISHHHDPLLSLSIDEITLRMESEPYQPSRHSLTKSSQSSLTHDAFMPLFSQRTIGYSRGLNHPVTHRNAGGTDSSEMIGNVSTEPRQRVDISISGLIGSLPHSAHAHYQSASHPNETIKQPGRVVTLASASVVIDRGSPDLLISADNFHLRYTNAVLELIPQIAQLVLLTVPIQLLPFTPTDSCRDLPIVRESSIPMAPGSFVPLAAPVLPQPAATARTPGQYPVPIVTLKGTVTNITVDFPYVLEFADSDAENDNDSDVHSHSDATASTHTQTSNDSDSEMKKISEKTLEEIRKFNEKMNSKTSSGGVSSSGDAGATVSVNDASKADDDTTNKSSPDLVYPPSQQSPASAAPLNASQSPSQSKRTSLFSLVCSAIDLSVYIPTQQWSITLNHSYGLHESIPFITIETANLTGANATDTTVKSLNVSASGIEGDWSPPMFLGLYKLIKDCVSHSINLKHALFGADGLSLVTLTGPVPTMTTMLDYAHDPTLSLLHSKKNYVDAFRLWYHHIRARYLSEPYMHVTLHVRCVALRACLNRMETLNAFIAVEEFSSVMIPNDFTFKGITLDLLMHPLVHVDTITLRRHGLDLTPLTKSYSEEQNLLMEYLDLDLVLDGVRMELAPQMDIGPLLQTIILKIQAVVTSIWELPRLDTLSRRLGGPGYHQPPPPPPPGLSIVITNCQFAMIDEPMESFLSHLHQLWLKEKFEQEKRFSIIRLKMANSANNSSGSDEQSLLEGLNVYNARSYYNRVQAFKQSFSEGTDIKRAKLMLAAIDTMTIDMSLIGDLGSFYDETVIVRLINQRKAEEDGVFDSESVSESAGSVLTVPSVSPPLLSLLTPPLHPSSPLSLTSPPASSRTNTAAAMIPTNFSFLAARYFTVSISGIRVNLRNFPSPLFTCELVTVSGNAAIAQTSPLVSMNDSEDAIITVPMSPLTVSSANSALLSPWFKPIHTRSTSDPSYHSRSRSHYSPMRATVDVGGVHAVDLELKYRPFQFFYDVSANVQEAKLAFAPCFVYALNDVVKALTKLVPPLPSLYPIEPIRIIAGHTKRGKSVTSDNAIEPINYLHLLRGITHGRLALNVSDTSIHLIAGHTVYDKSKYLEIDAKTVSVSVLGPLLTVTVRDVNIYQMPKKERQANLIEMPMLELGTTVNWICHNHCNTGDEADSGKRFRHVSIGHELDERDTEEDADAHGNCRQSSAAAQQQQQPRMRPPALLNVHSHRRHSHGQRHQRHATMPEHAIAHTHTNNGNHGHSCSHDSNNHTCSLHVSLSLIMSSPPPKLPLAVTLHSSSLASLASVLSIYSKIPPYPIPARQSLNQYYSAYHRERVRRYANAMLAANIPIQHATLILLEDNMNDLMIGMMARVEIDSGILSEILSQNQRQKTKKKELSEERKGFVRQLSANHPHLQRQYTEIMEGDVGTTVRHHNTYANTHTGNGNDSSSHTIDLGGVYLERLLIDSITVTVWEGANLGPARGLRLAIKSIDLCTEFVHEINLATVPVDALKRAKIFVDLSKKAKNGSASVSDEEGGSASVENSHSAHHTKRSRSTTPSLSPVPRWHDRQTSSPSVSPQSDHGHARTGHDNGDRQSLIYSLSNTIFRLRQFQCSIVHNNQWQSLAHTDDLSSTLANSNRVVVYTYENQRYTLGKGWSARNLLPTDRFAWSNATGTEEVLRENIRLPSNEWEWEHDWQLDFHLRQSGEVDEEGWEYAHDFPRKYSRIRTWYCNVRRRRWIRVRKLKNSSAAMNVHDSAKIRQAKKVENAGNFLASVSLLAIHQKPHIHTHTDTDIVIDGKRRRFRGWISGELKEIRKAQLSGSATNTQTNDDSGRDNDSGIGGGTNDFVGMHRIHSVSSQFSNPNDTSLLSYFHIRDSEDTGANTEIHPQSLNDSVLSHLPDGEEDALLADTRGVFNDVSVPNHTTNDRDRHRMSVLELSPSLSRFAAKPSASPPSQSQLSPAPSSSRSPSPLLSLPTQHQLRVLDPKLLLTLEIRSTLTTLIDQYSATISELLASDRKWFSEGRRAERLRESEKRVLAKLDMEQTVFDTHNGSEPSNLFSPTSSVYRSPSHSSLGPLQSQSELKRRSSLPRVNVNQPSLHAPLTPHRGRFASAEDASHRPPLSLANSGRMTPSGKQSSLPTSSLSLPQSNSFHFFDAHAQAHTTIDTLTQCMTTTSTPTLSFLCQCAIDPHSMLNEAQEWFCLEVINPQINCHSEETRGRLLFMTARITLFGRIDWIHSVHHPNTGTHIHTNNGSGSDGFRLHPPSRALSHSFVQSQSQSQAVPVLSRDKFRLSMVLDDIQAFVAPTDIDVDAGVIWMNRSNRGVLKSIMQPATFQINASVRPELVPIERHRIIDSDTHTDSHTTKGSGSPSLPTVPSQSQLLSHSVEPSRVSRIGPLSSSMAPLSVNINDEMLTLTGKLPSSQSQAQLWYDTVPQPQPQSSTPLPNPHGKNDSGNVSATHSLVIPPSESNTIDIQLPELTFNLDAYQFSLLIDVLKTINSPLPMSSLSDDDVDRGLVNNHRLEELQRDAVLLSIKLQSLVWQMKEIEFQLMAATTNTHTNNESSNNSGSQSQTFTFASAAANAQSQSFDSLSLASPSATAFSSFQSWLLETTNRLDRERESSTVMKVLGADGLYSRFYDLLNQHNDFSQRFLSLILAIHSKEKSLYETKLKFLTFTLLCERINYLMMKNEIPFTNLYLDELNFGFSAKSDSTLETSIELKSLGGRNLLSHYQDPTRSEYQWQEIVSLYNQTKSGASTDSSAWNYKELMVHASLIVRINDRHVTVQHCEMNLHPISVRLTYESLNQIIDYFVTEQQKLTKKYANDREKFLPLSQTIVLDVKQTSSHALSNTGSGNDRSQSNPPSPKADSSKSMKQRMKGMAQKMRFPFGHDSNSHTQPQSATVVGSHSSHPSISVTLPSSASASIIRVGDDDADALTHTDNDSDSHTNTIRFNLPNNLSLSTPSHTGSVSEASRKMSASGKMPPSLAVSDSDTAGNADTTSSTTPTAETNPVISFNYVRFGASLLVVSYWSGGYTKYKIEDFQGLPIKVKPLLIQNKDWTVGQIGNHLKKEMIRMALGQMTEALGKFIGYKLGFSKPATMDEIAMQAYQANDSGSVNDDSGSVGHSHSYNVSHSTVPVTMPSGLVPQPVESVIKPSYSSSSPSSLQQAVTSGTRRLNQKFSDATGGIKLLFGEKSSKKRKGSDASGVPPIPPRPPRAVLTVNVDGPPPPLPQQSPVPLAPSAESRISASVSRPRVLSEAGEQLLAEYEEEEILLSPPKAPPAV